MAFELVYTSASQGLRLGSIGFCTVARHENMPDGLVLDLEKLSGFDLPPGIENVQAIYSFLTIERPTGKYWVFCRKRVCEIPDYSGRSNYIAHHLVLDEEEVERLSSHKGHALTPTSILLSFNWRDEFQGEAHLIPEERSIESIFETAFQDKDAIHDVRQLLGEQDHNREQYLRVPVLFNEEIQPKPACFIDSSLHSEAGSKNLLKLLHFATLISSPWLGENCGEDFFPGAKYPVQPRNWWDWGLTTMLIHNDKSSRYSWIGISEERGATAAGTSRLILRLDQWPSGESSPQILRSFVEEPEEVLNKPEKIRLQRRTEAHVAKLRAEFMRLQEEKELLHIELSTLKPRHEDYRRAYQSLDSENTKVQNLVAELENKLKPVIGVMSPRELRADFQKHRRIVQKMFPLNIWRELCQKFHALSNNVERDMQRLRNADESYARSRVNCHRKHEDWGGGLSKFRQHVTIAAGDLGTSGEQLREDWVPHCEAAERRLSEFEAFLREYPPIGDESMPSAGKAKFEAWQEMIDWIIEQFTEQERTEKAQQRRAWLVKNKKWVIWGASFLIVMVLILVYIRPLFQTHSKKHDVAIEVMPAVKDGEIKRDIDKKSEPVTQKPKEILIGGVPAKEALQLGNLPNKGTPADQPKTTQAEPKAFYLIVYEADVNTAVRTDELVKAIPNQELSIGLEFVTTPFDVSRKNAKKLKQISKDDFLENRSVVKFEDGTKIDINSEPGMLKIHTDGNSPPKAGVFVLEFGAIEVICIPTTALESLHKLFDAEFARIFRTTKLHDETEVKFHGDDRAPSVECLNKERQWRIEYSPFNGWPPAWPELPPLKSSEGQGGEQKGSALRVQSFKAFLTDKALSDDKRVKDIPETKAAIEKVRDELSKTDKEEKEPIPGTYSLVLYVQIKESKKRIVVYSAESRNKKRISELPFPTPAAPANK